MGSDIGKPFASVAVVLSLDGVFILLEKDRKALK